MEQSNLLRLRGLRQRGHSLHLVSLNPLGPLAQQLDLLGISGTGLSYRGRFGWRSFPEMRRNFARSTADAVLMTGFAPLTATSYFDTVKRLPCQARGTRKQALRDAFADVLPSEVINAPKRGLRPLNRELLKSQADDGIARLRDDSNSAWNSLFNKDVLIDFWLAHRDGVVYRSNLLYKALIFRAWCDRWQPQLPEKSI